MASGGQQQAYPSCKERTNYARLCRAIVDLSTQVLRDVLNRQVPPSQIRHKAHICTDLKLNPFELNKLKAAPSRGYKEFDVSLLYILIRKLCPTLQPTNGWTHKYPPTSAETTEGDDVERIHFIRNEIYGHLAHTCIWNTQFSQYWQILQGVMVRMDTRMNGQYSTELSYIETDCMDSGKEMEYLQCIGEMEKRDKDLMTEVKKINEKINKLSNDVTNLSKDLIDRETNITAKLTDEAECKHQITLAAIDDHRKDQPFLSTKGTAKGLDILKQHGVLIYSGLAGSGKSTNAMEVMSRYHELFPHFKALELSDVTKWSTHVNPKIDMIILLDDILGKSNTKVIDEGSKCWKQIHACISTGKVKVIMTMRSTILEENYTKIEHFKIFSKKHVIDLSSDIYQLSSEEKYEIFSLYSKRNKIEICKTFKEENYNSEDILDDDVTVKICQLTVDEITEMNPIIGFPQACVLFCSLRKYTRLGENFFRNPTQNLVQEMTKLRKSKDEAEQIHYCILAYMLINHGEIDLGDFINEKFEKILRAVECHQKPSLLAIKDSVSDITNTYILKVSKTVKYKFKHETILEAVALDFGSCNMGLLLQSCDWAFINEFIKTNIYEEKEGEIILKLQTRMDFECLVNKCMGDILDNSEETGYFSFLHSQAFQDSDFVNFFMDVIQNNQQYTEALKVSCMSRFGIFFDACELGTPLVDKLYSSFHQYINTSHHLQTACQLTTKWFLDKKIGLDDIDETLRYAGTEKLNCMIGHASVELWQVQNVWHALCVDADSKTVQIVLNRWPKLDLEYLTALLYSMCTKGETSSIHSLLSQRKELTSTDVILKCLLFACAKGQLDTFEFLLITQHRKTGASNFCVCQNKEKLHFIHVAAFFGRPNMVQYLLEKGAKMTETNGLGLSVLKAAVFGYVQADYRGNEKKKLNFDWNIKSKSPLLSSLYEEIILDDDSDPDDENEFYKLFSFFLKRKDVDFSDLFTKVDKHGNTFLHYCVNYNDVSIIELLLQNNKELFQKPNSQNYTPKQLAAFLGKSQVYFKLRSICSKDNNTMLSTTQQPVSDLLLAMIGFIYKPLDPFSELTDTFVIENICVAIPCFGETFHSNHFSTSEEYQLLLKFFVTNCQSYEKDLCRRLDEEGNTFLHYCVKLHAADFIKFLCEKRKDLVCVRNNQNYTIRNLAAYFGSSRIYETIYGECSEHEIGVSDTSLEIPFDLHLAILGFMFLKHSRFHGPVSLVVQNKNQTITLPTIGKSLFAFGSDYMQTFQFLLGVSKTNENVFDVRNGGDGNSLAHYCVLHNDISVLKLVSQKCKDLLFQPNKQSYTPKQFAAFLGRSKIYKTLHLLCNKQKPYPQATSHHNTIVLSPQEEQGIKNNSAVSTEHDTTTAHATNQGLKHDTTALETTKQLPNHDATGSETARQGLEFVKMESDITKQGPEQRKNVSTKTEDGLEQKTTMSGTATQEIGHSTTVSSTAQQKVSDMILAILGFKYHDWSIDYVQRENQNVTETSDNMEGVVLPGFDILLIHDMFSELTEYHQMIDFMINEYGADVKDLESKADIYGNTLAHYSVIFDSLMMIELIYKKRNPLLHDRNCNQVTPIQIAAVLGRSNIFRLIYNSNTKWNTEEEKKYQFLAETGMTFCGLNLKSLCIDPSGVVGDNAIRCMIELQSEYETIMGFLVKCITPKFLDINTKYLTYVCFGSKNDYKTIFDILQKW